MRHPRAQYKAEQQLDLPRKATSSYLFTPLIDEGEPFCGSRIVIQVDWWARKSGAGRGNVFIISAVALLLLAREQKKSS